MNELRRERKGRQGDLTVEAVRVRIEVEDPFLTDRKVAADLRHRFLDSQTPSDRPVLIDLEAIDYITIASATTLIGDYLGAGRARHPLVAILATSKVDVIEAIDAALQRSHQSAYWVRSTDRPDHPELIGEVTSTNTQVLEFFVGTPAVTAASYADAENLKPNAATQRLVDLTKRGLLLRVSQPGKQGDRFVYPFVPNGKAKRAPRHADELALSH